MANWRDEYFAALRVRDEREKSNARLFDAYTKLADRSSNLAPSTQTGPPAASSPSGASTPSANVVPRKTGASPAADIASRLPDTLAAARADLSAAQRSRVELQAHVASLSSELDELRNRTQRDRALISSLRGQQAHLQQRLKDRDEELRGKAKLLDDVQDELASLNLQFNMAEERADNFQRENQELIDRWMAHKGQEADAMNEASKFS